MGREGEGLVEGRVGKIRGGRGRGETSYGLGRGKGGGGRADRVENPPLIGLHALV